MPHKPAQTLPAFTPVPRLKDRSNGWKPEVQLAFIEALAETGSVRAACRRVGRSEHGVYALRHHPEGKAFRKAWDVAADLGVRRIEDAAMDRALNGVEETLVYHGDVVGHRRRYNESLVMFILRNRAPHRFAEGGGSRSLNAVDKQMLKRLKKQWRQEWLRERVAEEDEDEQETLDSLDRFLENMARNREANMSPRARAAYAEARRIEAEDGISWMLDDDEDADDPANAAPPEPSPLLRLPPPPADDEPEPE